MIHKTIIIDKQSAIERGTLRHINRKGFLIFMISFMISFLILSCGSGGGAGEFDKLKAAKAIFDSIKSDQFSFLKNSGKAIEYIKRETPTGSQQYLAFCKGSKIEQDGLIKLEEQGFLKIQNDQQSGCHYISFLDKAEPYIKKNDKSALVMLAKVDKVEVTDLGDGKQTRAVQYKAYYSPTPFGETYLKPENLTEEKEAGFTLSFDEGWRIN